MFEAHRPAVRLIGLPACLDIRQGGWRELPPKAAALLATLIVDGAASRAVMAARLWPSPAGGDVDKPRVNLRGLLRDLRGWSHAELVSGADSLVLAPGVEHDLDALTGPSDLVSADQVPTGELLMAGDYRLLDEFSDWLEAARARWQTASAQALDRLAQRHEGAGRLDLAIAIASRRVDESPLDEAAHRLLMRLLGLRGDRNAARQAFVRCQKLLKRHLGAEPAQATRALAMLIELGEAATRRPLPAGRTDAALAPLSALRLVGRAAELKVLGRAGEQARRVLLEGEPGVGKSRLLAELAQGESGALLVTACLGDADLPFATLTRLLQELPAWVARSASGPAARLPWPQSACDELARLMPGWGRPSAPRAQTYRLVAALVDLFAACHAQGLQRVLLDDLQWADEPSLGLLLASTRATTGPGWVLARRAGPRPALFQSLLDMATGPPQVDASRAGAQPWQLMHLPPLSLADVQALLRETSLPLGDPAAWAATLYACAPGSPLHLLEMLAALRHEGGDAIFRAPPPAQADLPVPAALDALLQARCARLDGPARRLAQLAALAGPLFSAGLACRLMDINAFELAEHWSRLAADGVLQGAGLAHDSLHQPLLQLLPAPMRRELHGRIAQEAAVLGARAAEVAQHLWLAGQWALAAVAFEQAAADAFALGARAAELLLWERAAACHGSLDHPDAVFAALLKAADAALSALPPEQLEERAATLAAAARSPAQRVDSDLFRARLALTLYRLDEGLAASQAAMAGLASLLLQPLGDADDVARRLRVRCVHAAALAWAGRAAEATELMQVDRAAVAQTDDARLKLDHASTQAYVQVLTGRFFDAEQAYRDALVHARALDDPAEVSVVATNLSHRLFQRGDVPAALDCALQAVDALRLMDRAEGVMAAAAYISVGAIRWRLGQLDLALHALRNAHDLSQDIAAQRWRAGCECFMALVWVDLGRADLAQQTLNPWPDGLKSGLLQRAMAEVAVARLRGEPVHPCLLGLRAASAGEPMPARLVLELAISSGLDPASAVDLCRTVAQQAETAGLIALQQSAWFHEADALRRAGDARQAEARLLPALHRLPRCAPQNLYLPQAWSIALAVLADAGQADAAQDVLRQACQWVLVRAKTGVPAAHRQDFLHANPVNRGLLQAAQRAAIPLDRA